MDIQYKPRAVPTGPHGVQNGITELSPWASYWNSSGMVVRFWWMGR